MCRRFSSKIVKYLGSMRNDPAILLLTSEMNCNTPVKSIPELFYKAEKSFSPETTAHLLQALLSAEVKTNFYKIHVHAALTPEDIKKKFEPVFSQALSFTDSKKFLPGSIATQEAPIVTVNIS